MEKKSPPARKWWSLLARLGCVLAASLVVVAVQAAADGIQLTLHKVVGMWAFAAILVISMSALGRAAARIAPSPPSSWDTRDSFARVWARWALPLRVRFVLGVSLFLAAAIAVTIGTGIAITHVYGRPWATVMMSSVGMALGAVVLLGAHLRERREAGTAKRA